MIKVPATLAGLPVIEQLLSEGINVNVTLIFSIDRYMRVVDAYKKGAKAYYDKTGKHVHSVASFFVSRLDSSVEKLLVNSNKQTELTKFVGHVGVANCRKAYAYFVETFLSSNSDKTIAPQRVLWASTSAKSKLLNPLFYVESLCAENSVNTLPHATLEELLKGSTPKNLSTISLEDSEKTLKAFEGNGFSLAEINKDLETQGVESFVNSYDDLLQAISNKAKLL
jgi:transaldolase